MKGTIPLELNILKEKTTDVNKIYKILDEFNVKLDNRIRAKNEFSVRFNSIRQKEGTTGWRTNRKSQRINRKHKRT